MLYDTLLKDFTPAETRLVVAHELGHVRYRDVPHGLLWLALVAPLGTLAIARASERLTRPGTTAVPAVALTLAIVAPALTTISNQLSRDVERRADAFALDLTGEPDAMVGFERRITLQNVGDPDPPRWQQVLLSTHPATMERIGQALAPLAELRPVVDLGQALDALRRAPLGPVVLHGVDQLAHRLRGDRHAGDDDARHLVVLDLVVHARERQRELVVGVRDRREVRVYAGHHLGRRVEVEVAFALVGAHPA